jgi:hypothetical protein
VAPKTKELVAICEQLPPQKVEELVDFARFLRQQAAIESEGDKQWESLLADARPRPKLDAFAAGSLREGQATPLDPDAL